MLKSISLKNLFGLYSYELSLENEDNSPVKFITGPNGYGKTTILRLIDALYRQDWQVFIKTDFEAAAFVFDNGSIGIMREDLSAEEEDSDEPAEPLIHVAVNYTDQSGECVSTVDAAVENGGYAENYSGKYAGNLRLFLETQDHYYLPDTRLYLPAGTLAPVVERNRQLLAKQMGDMEVRVNERLYGASSPAGTPVLTAREYNRMAEELAPLWNTLGEYGIVAKSILPAYDKEHAQAQTAFMHNLQATSEAYGNLIGRIATFHSVINRLGFSNKDLVVKKSFGYRFKIRNAKGAMISAEHLSSGEQHMLVQIYDLLFNTENDALVLIDEPEMSLHMAWQVDYLSIITEICRKRSLHAVICTHSPQVFDTRWKLASDLYPMNLNGGNGN